MLELVDLRRHYGSTVALDGLSFSVKTGRVVGFLGPNGAGKTTAMRAVFDLVPLDSGHVHWKGSPIRPSDRRRFGYMPEERGLYPGMRVGEQVTYIGRLHGMGPSQAARAAEHWIGRLGLTDRMKDKIEALSLGNQQRAQLAAALVHDPELLVLDEPFSGLDPVGIDTMSDVLAERARAGAAVLFSSHQLDLVEHICEEVDIIDNGRLVASGPVDDLARGGHPTLEVKLTEDPAGDWARSLGDLGTVSSINKGMVSVVIGSRDKSQLVLDLARAVGTVEHFGFRRKHLSEVFREAVKAGTQ